MRTQTLCCLCLAAVLMVGCRRRDIASPAEVAGEYAFRFKTGEVEVVVMREDMTYQQEFYRTLTAYQQRDQPLYANSGTCSYKGIEIAWDGWLQFCEFNNPNRLRSVPKRFGTSYGVWLEPFRRVDAVITMHSDHDYYLRRVKSRSDVK